MHVSQYFTLTAKPFTISSFVLALGNRNCGVLPSIHSIDGVLTLTDSSVPGGPVFLGTIPGSMLDVMKRNTRS